MQTMQNKYSLVSFHSKKQYTLDTLSLGTLEHKKITDSYA